MKNLIAAIIFLVCATAHAANPSMAQLNFASNSLVSQISAGQVWTNDPGMAADIGTEYAIHPDISTNLVWFGITNANERLLIRQPNALDIKLGGGEILFANQVTGFLPIDIYGYNTGNSSATAAIVLGLDGSYGDCVLIDPRRDNGTVPFVFSSSASNVVSASGALFVLQTSHSTVMSVNGAGGISNSTFQTTSTLTTNATYIASLNGFASYATLATNAVTPTGWTNTAGVNVSGYVTATAVSFTINDRSGAVLYTSPTLTATLPVFLQNGWSLRAASGLVGTILPW